MGTPVLEGLTQVTAGGGGGGGGVGKERPPHGMDSMRAAPHATQSRAPYRIVCVCVVVRV